MANRNGFANRPATNRVGSLITMYENINEVLTTRTAQINGKSGDSQYIPDEKHSRPYYGYDARIDPTILNAVRNKYVDVSGLLIPNKDLPKNKNGMNRTQKPYRAYGIIV